LFSKKKYIYNILVDIGDIYNSLYVNFKRIYIIKLYNMLLFFYNELLLYIIIINVIIFTWKIKYYVLYFLFYFY
jgi:hypothetical protein